MIIQPKINLDVLSLSLLFQILLLTNNGYLQLANGVTTDPTTSGVISTSPIVNNNNSMLNEIDISSIDITPSMESVEIPSSPIPDISSSSNPDLSSLSSPDISSPSATLNIPNSINVHSSSAISSSEYSITPSETTMFTELPFTASLNFSETVTESSLIQDSSFYSMFPDTAFISSSTAINTDPTNQTSLQPDLFSKTSVMQDSSTLWFSDDLTSSSIIISPTQTITTDFVTTKIKDITDMTNNLSESTTTAAGKNLTLKSSESTSSKIAAGICIPLAILTVLGITFFFYRKRNQDRSVKFTDTGSTWSYANASFTDDAVKTGVKQNQ